MNGIVGAPGQDADNTAIAQVLASDSSFVSDVGEDVTTQLKNDPDFLNSTMGEPGPAGLSVTDGASGQKGDKGDTGAKGQDPDLSTIREIEEKQILLLQQ